MSDQQTWIVPLEQAPRECGRKAERLRLMAAAGHRIPRSWVLPFETYTRVLLHNRADVPRGLSGVPELPPALVAAITEVYNRVFAGAPVVVRSSARSEDTAFASCAGQYESFLNRTSAAEVVASVAACYASLNSRNARSYQELRQLDMDRESMAVMIQEMVSPERAGVLFTRDPVGRTDEMVVESVPGMGTRVVAGQGTPDRARIPRSTVCADPDLERLRTNGLALEELLGGPQDIEWGLAGGRLHIFQSRDAALASTVGPSAADLPAHPRSPHALVVCGGIAVGPLRPYPGEGPYAGAIVVIRDQSVDGVVDAVADGAGVVLSSGGLLSHLATVIREQGRPALRVEQPPGHDGEVIVLDAVTGWTVPVASVPPAAAKQWIFVAARNARRSNYTVERKVETVAFEHGLVRNLLARLRRRATPTFRGVQDIVPFDYLPRQFCEYSVRAQRTGTAVRVQFKRALKPESTFRDDCEVHVRVGSLDAAREHLCQLGLIEMPAQERALETHRFAGCVFSFMRWPGSTRMYVGVDGPDQPAVVSALRALGSPIDHRFNAVDGVQIFAELDVSLHRLTFADRDAVHSGRVRVDEEPW